MFKGADTDQMRNVAAGLDAAATSLETLLKQLRTDAVGLQWHGPDGNMFRQAVDGVLLGAQVMILPMTRANGDALRRHAAQQDGVSSTLEGGGGAPGGGPLSGFAPGGGYSGGGGGGGGGGGWGDGGGPTWTLNVGGDKNFGIERFLNGPGSFHAPSLGVTWDGPGADVAAVRLGANGSTTAGALALTGAASMSLLAANYSTSAGFSASSDGLEAKASVNAAAYLVDAKATGTATYGAVTGTASVRGTVGAEASADASVKLGKDGVVADAKAGAMAGAKVSGDASIGVSGATGSVHGEAIAGFGAKADIGGSISASQVKAHVEIGAAFGLGGSVAFDVDVEPAKIMKGISSWF